MKKRTEKLLRTKMKKIAKRYLKKQITDAELEKKLFEYFVEVDKKSPIV